MRVSKLLPAPDYSLLGYEVKTGRVTKLAGREPVLVLRAFSDHQRRCTTAHAKGPIVFVGAGD